MVRGTGLADGAGRGCAVCTWSADRHCHSSSLNLAQFVELVAHLRTGCLSVILAIAKALASRFPDPGDSGCDSAHSEGSCRYSTELLLVSVANCLADSWPELLLLVAPS